MREAKSCCSHNIEKKEEPISQLDDFKKRLIVAIPLAFLIVIAPKNTYGLTTIWLQLIFATPIVFWSGGKFFLWAWQALKMRKFNMFTLISLGTGIAYIYSLIITLFYNHFSELLGEAPRVYFEASAMIITLVLIGQILEQKAKAKTTDSIKSLLALAPNDVRIIAEDGSESDTSIENVKHGDKLRVLPGTKVPVDGVIIDGQGYVDQSMITGESQPVKKSIDDKIIGATLNISGSFIMRAEKVGKETMLAQIIEMVEKAQQTKAPIQRLADIVSGMLVPVIILIALITAAVWYLYGPEPSIAYAIINAVSVLVITCPCALGLATPMSIVVGTGLGAKSGIVISNIAALETLGKASALIIDKTGTITEGKPRVTSTSFDDPVILEYATSLEINSEHPIASAITAYAREQNIKPKPVQNFTAIAGNGVTGEIDGKQISLGNAALMSDLNIKTVATDEAKTIIYVAVDKKLSGTITIFDPIKESSYSAIKMIHDMQIETYMLTGDNQQVADAVASELNIEHIEANVLPDRKAALVEELQAQGKTVIMAGDGINDSPALAQANVGIAMGTGTDIAIENADITLVKGDLTGIAKSIKLSRETIKNIKQNLFFAFIYNALGVPIAAGILYPHFGILLGPTIASGAMALSSISVILNSLRISRAKLT